MCGRFSLGLAHSEIQQVQGYPNINVGEWVDQGQFVPRYNIAPYSQAPVLRRKEGASDGGPKHFIQTMRWGLVPHWSKHEDKSLNTINARCENLVRNGGMWGSIKGKNRCVVLAQGYYEWLKKGNERIPWYTKFKDGRIMLLAGLYDCTVLESETKPLWTFSIVTTAANKEFEWLHERQPVILSSQAAIDTWLDTSTQTWSDQLTDLVMPYHDSTSPIECYQVPKEVGKVGKESESFIKPVSQRKDGIEAMFSNYRKNSPTKRKRTPPAPAAINAGESSVTIDETPSKRPRTDSVEVIEPPLGSFDSSKSLQTPSKPKPTLKSPSKATPLKKSPKKAQPSQGNKITQFFSKV